jgi:aminocarboxymuconate-semialdehyde decarboxylase
MQLDPALLLSLAKKVGTPFWLYDAATMRRLVDVFGAAQVMVGTDYPFSIMDNEPLGRLESTGLPPEVIRMLRSENAARWLGLPVVES